MPALAGACQWMGTAAALGLPRAEAYPNLIRDAPPHGKRMPWIPS